MHAQALSSALEDVPQEPSALGKAEAPLAQSLLMLVKHVDKVGFGFVAAKGPSPRCEVSAPPTALLPCRSDPPPLGSPSKPLPRWSKGPC